MKEDTTRVFVDVEPIALRSTPKKLQERRGLYEDRKLAGQCVECGVDLDEEHDCNRCDDCQERRALSSKIYRRSERGLASVRESKRKERDRRLKLGLCARCSLPRAQWEAPAPGQKPNDERASTCPVCRREMSAINAAYRRRRKAGLVPTPKERRAKRQEERKRLLAELHGRDYKPIDEQLARPRVRLLRALLRFGGFVTQPDLFVALDVPDACFGDDAVRDDTTRERDALSSALSRLAKKYGLVERRRTIGAAGPIWEYRLTPAGTVEARKAVG